MATVLVIEDNPTNRKLVVLILQQGGHAVLQAPDAESGLAIARAERPALVLMDIQLPGMSGFEALAELRSDPETAAIPVIAVTAMAMKGDADRVRAAGFNGYVTKPLRYEELLSAVALHLQDDSADGMRWKTDAG